MERTEEETQEQVKKREAKLDNKLNEQLEEVKEAKPPKSPIDNKVQKTNENQEIWAKPPSLEEINKKFEGSYLEQMKFSTFQPLIDLKGRVKCPKWKSNRKFYWYLWYELLVKDIPQLKLPVNFTILKHPGEKMGKSSIIASKMLAPDDVTIHNSLEVPDFDNDSTILLFPRDDSVPVTSMTKEELEKVKNVVLIDSTWHQVNKFIHNKKVGNLKAVVINTQKTIFWRYQKGITDKNLSTIEAMYFFLRDYVKTTQSEYNNEYDDLLYFYAYNYALIQNEYIKGQKKNTDFRKIKGYIQAKKEED